jgi:hypothetical protein
MIRGAVLLGALALGAFTGGGPKVGPLPACPAGVVIVHGDDMPGCDVVGGVNTLTVLDITEPACADIGGTWWYEACERVDF